MGRDERYIYCHIFTIGVTVALGDVTENPA